MRNQLAEELPKQPLLGRFELRNSVNVKARPNGSLPAHSLGSSIEGYFF